MGRVASSVDNALIESFWSTMQRELLDRRHWTSRVDLAAAIFEWIEGWYNPTVATPPWAICPRTSTRPFTPPPSPRHDHHTKTVRETGSGSSATTSLPEES
ncbi:integrase core domain-containing protein [Janibacter melonis]|uniref:integrase core domain-containing protein n=1 Tax=Janibacter melonis TaxID=262209 RepID=UPI003556DF8A